MADKPKKKPPPKDEDGAQSARFIEAAKALEADGELNPIGAEEAFERLLSRAAPPKHRPD
ncbi:MAG: hypothetical protein JWP23_1080 [Phenylobacterium sp.]|nr:hypothetical protein [Phenylobacterium sp.]